MMAPQPVPSIEQQIAASLRQLLDLNVQGEQARAEVARVQAELAQLNAAARAAEGRLDATYTGRLLEANEKLVVSLLQAQANAGMYAEALKKISRSAEHDALTGLPNRALMLDRLGHAVAVARRKGTRLALLSIDLNNFKSINDTLGHGVGDQMLQSAAGAMVLAIRDGDIVSRYGGDEFLILLNDIEHATDASQVAEKVVSALGMPCRIGDHILRLSASIGISIYPDDGDTAELLIDRADSAMSRAKRPGTASCDAQSDPADAPAVIAPLPLASLQLPINHVAVAAAEHERRVGELRDANEALVIAALDAQELQAAAESSQQRQREFLALVAHELRNPMTPLVVAASLLRGSDADDLERMRQIIEQQVAHMNRMVCDLLDMSRCNTGKLRLEFRPVELRRIIDEAIDASRPAMDIRLQRIDVKLPPQPVKMQADPVRLAQILINLLDNASKYTPQGGEIHLSASVEDDHVVIRLADNGIGISTDALARVFEPFAQDLHATAFNNEGLGLGLSVVKQLVEGHGGTVVVSSSGIGLGTQFTVTLPLMGNAACSPSITRAD